MRRFRRALNQSESVTVVAGYLGSQFPLASCKKLGCPKIGMLRFPNVKLPGAEISIQHNKVMSRMLKSQNRDRDLLCTWSEEMYNVSSILTLRHTLLVPILEQQGYLSFIRENRKFQLEDQMVRAIPFEKLKQIWALICGDAIFLLF